MDHFFKCYVNMYSTGLGLLLIMSSRPSGITSVVKRTRVANALPCLKSSSDRVKDPKKRRAALSLREYFCENEIAQDLEVRNNFGTEPDKQETMGFVVLSNLIWSVGCWRMIE